MKSRYSLLEFLVLVALVLVFIAMLIPACRSAQNKALQYDTGNKVLEDSIIQGTSKSYRYTKFDIEGHEFFFIGEDGAYRKGPLTHCPDCRKCKGEQK